MGVKVSHPKPTCKQCGLSFTPKDRWRSNREAKFCSYKCANEYNKNENNPRWKGSMAGYATLHDRTSQKKGKPKKCEMCGTADPNKQYQWASMTKKYDDPSDYRRLCRSCHSKLDKVYLNFYKGNTHCRTLRTQERKKNSDPH